MKQLWQSRNFLGFLFMLPAAAFLILFLAVLLHQKFIRGKSAWRVLLILPWAVPQYITALTWRGIYEHFPLEEHA